MSIYGSFEPVLQDVLSLLVEKIEAKNARHEEETGFSLYEHLHCRIKSETSMLDKCQRKGLAPTEVSALKDIKDSVGIRIVCGFVDDIYTLVEFIRPLDGVVVYNERDFVTQAKPNGYRSYHLIVEVSVDAADCLGNVPGTYFAEIQLRTITMDSWASLEHQLKYKHDIHNTERIVKELKRCADELASCDLTMQTIRNLIQESQG
ncbi:MAG: GTP pyrophosphokinase family protein [Atopobium minutum]|uniref:GTP pyrophosphokinase n=1 Tax=Atopobium minutum TaxID=1381 RepID=UPI001DBEEE7F|nr:GTP pyrophosphokinase family protein [Atopobium minutum]MBS4874118.1 GTP pyrophosphokinase family protein [Atopobium minutum]